MELAISLTLDGKTVLPGGLSQAFVIFQSHLEATEEALTKAKALYGPNAYVELEFNAKKRFSVNCWIWNKVLGGNVILGNAETWEQAFADAAEKTAEPATDED